MKRSRAGIAVLALIVGGGVTAYWLGGFGAGRDAVSANPVEGAGPTTGEASPDRPAPTSTTREPAEPAIAETTGAGVVTGSERRPGGATPGPRSDARAVAPGSPTAVQAAPAPGRPGPEGPRADVTIPTADAAGATGRSGAVRGPRPAERSAPSSTSSSASSSPDLSDSPDPTSGRGEFPTGGPLFVAQSSGTDTGASSAASAPAPAARPRPRPAPGDRASADSSPAASPSPREELEIPEPERDTDALEPPAADPRPDPVRDEDDPRDRGGRRDAEAADEPEPAAVPHVWMVVDAAEATVGTIVSVQVWIAGAEDVGSVPFHVLFNPAVLRFDGGLQGPFLASDGRQTAFFAAPTSSGETVVVGLSRLGRGDGIAGSGELCVLRFETVGPGLAGLTFARAKVRDSSNRIVPAVFEPASLVVR